MAQDYKALQNAVFDLLSELRINKESLAIMAKGYSPDYPGAISKADWDNPYCKVQLSMVVAQKILANI